MGIARRDGEAGRVSAPSTIMRIFVVGPPAVLPMHWFPPRGSHCRLMVFHCRGINRDAFNINAFHPLLELLKQFCPDAPLGPTVEFGVNASPFAVFDGQGPPAQPIGKRMKDGDKECFVVLGGAACFPKWTAKFPS